ncbi:MAG: hypothetical protein DBY20_01160 [Coriobacteriia bacterium]|nr:MAG: hypothetical protein DBY20_01160 [Coriobacteriia bacterium]
MRIIKTSTYEKWFRRLRDRNAQARINARLRRIGVHGEVVGDFRILGDKVIELRFDMGPGYRIYVTVKKEELLLLLVGGDKSTQDADIRKAKELSRLWRDTDEA